MMGVSSGSRSVLVVALVALAMLVCASCAAAALDVASYRVVTKNVPVAAGHSGGDYLSCPNGTRVVTGGAFWHGVGSAHPRPGAGPITNSTPTTNAKGWYAAGSSYASVELRLEEVAMCVPRKQVSGYSVMTQDFSPGYDQVGGDYVSCPNGTRIVTGGVFLHQMGTVDPDPSGGEITNSAPTTDGKSWYATGYNFGLDQLQVVALCLPHRQVGDYRVKTRNVPVVGGASDGAYLSCRNGRRVVAGGAFWHAPGSGVPITTEAWMTNSVPTKDGRRWFAAGSNGPTEELRLEVVALCLPPA